MAWYRKLIARKFDGSKYRQYPGRPKVGREVAELVSRSHGPGEYRVGYDRIAGALSNLGHDISDQTVGNILRHFGIAPAPKRRQNTNWADFIRSHMAVSGWDRFLHCGGAELAWIGYLLRPVLYSSGDSTRYSSGDHQTSHRALDVTNGSDCAPAMPVARLRWPAAL